MWPSALKAQGRGMNEIRITAQLLRDKDVCTEGIEAFIRRFGETGELVWYGDHRDKKTIRREKSLRPYLMWAVANIRLTGNVSRLTGNVSGLIGNVSRLIGDVSRLTGDVSGLTGDVTYISGRITKKRAKILGLIGTGGTQ